MTVEEFLSTVSEGLSIDTPEAHALMDSQSAEARKITANINDGYKEMDEIRGLFSKLIGEKVDSSFRLFPPFQTDFGRNIHVGKNVFINSY